jgi:ribosome biogenesis protein ENP2
MGVGTAGGLVALYDVRSSKPLHIKEHKHGMPIHTIKFHPGSGCVLSSDEKLVKIWKYKATGDLVNIGNEVSASSVASVERFNYGSNGSALGAVIANVEGTGKFTNFIVAGDEKDSAGNRSGLLLCATDQPKVEAYYIPKVGLAPSWCSFLENVTEELEERDLNRDVGPGTSGDVLVKDGQETVFENYKFVSRDDLEKLGVSDLIGTPLLKAYMHGFFMDINLYNKVRAVANPFEYEEYRKKKIKERLEAKRASRIAPKTSNSGSKKSSSVNPDLAQRLHSKASANTKAGKAAKGILSDDRFGDLFSNPDYHIDEEDENFKLRNPSGVASAATKRKRNEDMDSDEDEADQDIDDGNDNKEISNEGVAGFQRFQDEDDDEGEDDSHGDFDSDTDDEDGFRGGKVRGEAYGEVKKLQRKGMKPKSKMQKGKSKKSMKSVMYEADGMADVNAARMGDDSSSKNVKEKIRRMNMPLEKRFQMQQEEESCVRVIQKGGSKEITYIPKDSRGKTPNDTNGEEGAMKRDRSKRSRRGIKELGFRTPFKNR